MTWKHVKAPERFSAAFCVTVFSAWAALSDKAGAELALWGVAFAVFLFVMGAARDLWAAR